jgi:hypothetical protein
MSRQPNHRSRSDDFGETITNLAVRGYFYELLEILTNLGEDVEINESPVDIRVEYSGNTICRLVPYRELIHLHVGEGPVWEVRIRDEAGYLEAVDRILDVFLFLAARTGGFDRGHSGIAVVRR